MLTLLFRLPFLPVQGVIRLADLIRDEAERQLHDPARVRRQLEEAEQARLDGKISDEELLRVEEEVLGSLLATGQPLTDVPSQVRPGRTDHGDRS